MGHGQALYNEVTRVPLILRLPGVIPQARQAAVDAELIDVTPTILQLLSVELPQHVQGKNLLPYFFAPEDYRRGVATFSKSGERTSIRSWDSIRFGGYMLMENKLGGFNRKNEWARALYDTSKDPGEKFNIWPRKPIVGKALYQSLMWRLHSDDALKRSYGEDADSSEKQEIDPEVVERLRALGYVD